MTALIIAVAAIVAVALLAWIGICGWRALRTDVRDLRNDHTQLAAVVSAASSAAEIIRDADAPPIPTQELRHAAAPKRRDAARKSNLRLIHSTKALALLVAAGVVSIGRQVRDHQVAAAGTTASLAMAGLVTLAVVGGGTEPPEAESAPVKSAVPPATRQVSPPVIGSIVPDPAQPVVDITAPAPAARKIDGTTATAATRSMPPTRSTSASAPHETTARPAPADGSEPEAGDNEHEQPSSTEPPADTPSNGLDTRCINNPLAAVCVVRDVLPIPIDLD